SALQYGGRVLEAELLLRAALHESGSRPLAAEALKILRTSTIPPLLSVELEAAAPTLGPERDAFRYLTAVRDVEGMHLILHDLAGYLSYESSTPPSAYAYLKVALDAGSEEADALGVIT